MLLAKDKIGFVNTISIDSESSTGYSIVYMIEKELKKFPCTKELYELQFTEEYIFPMITETPKVMQFDENGIATGFRAYEPGIDFYGEYGYGCADGFGAVYQIENGKLVIDGKKWHELERNGRIAHYGHYAIGTFKPIPEETLTFDLADDIEIYCLDFYGGDRVQKPRDLWYLNDVLENHKNCYWLNVYDFWNGEGKIDLVVMFRQPPKGKEARGGNLDETGFTKKYRFKEATGSDYDKEVNRGK